MKKHAPWKMSRLALSMFSIFLFIIITLLVLDLYFITKSNKRDDSYSVDKPDYFRSDAAIPKYTLKWLENLKYSGKGLLTHADLRILDEGEISKLSFKHGLLNIDKNANINYPFVVRMELYNTVNNNRETLYFSQTRYEKANIYKIDSKGSRQKIKWEQIKIGDYAQVEEQIDLLVPNTDKDNNFTDNYVKSLFIYIK